MLTTPMTEIENELSNPLPSISGITVLPTGEVVVNSAAAGIVNIYDQTGEIISTLQQDFGNPITSMLSTPQALILGDNNGLISLHAPATGEIIRKFSISGRPISAMMQVKGLVLAAAGYRVYITDLEFINHQTFSIPGFPITAMTTIESNGHRLIAAAGRSTDPMDMSPGKVVVWDTAEKEPALAIGADLVLTATTVGNHILFGTNEGAIIPVVVKDGIPEFANPEIREVDDSPIRILTTVSEDSFISGSSNGKAILWTINPVDSSLILGLETEHLGSIIAAGLYVTADLEKHIISVGTDNVIKISGPKINTVFSEFIGKITVAKISTNTSNKDQVLVGDDKGNAYLLGITEAGQIVLNHKY